MLFKPSVMQSISQTPYDLNNELLVRNSGHGLNNEPFDGRTVLDHSNTELVCQSDPYCSWVWNMGQQNVLMFFLI